MEENYWEKVDIKDNDSCWEWKAGCNSGGYGLYQVNHVNILAHRYAWIITNRQEIPEGMIIMHKCDNPKCCNPNHLKLGTLKDNTQDMLAKKRNGGSVKGLNQGSTNGNAKLSEEDVLQIYVLHRAGDSIGSIARKYQVGHNTISNIVKGKHWAHLYKYYGEQL